MGRRGFRLRSGRGGWFGSCGDPGLEWPETQACLESAGASACGIFRALQKNLPPAAIALAPFLKQKNVKEQGPTPLPVNRWLVVDPDPAMGRERSAANFIRAIEGSEEPLNSPGQAISLMRIIDAAYASSASGKPVEVTSAVR